MGLIALSLVGKFKLRSRAPRSGARFVANATVQNGNCKKDDAKAYSIQRACASAKAVKTITNAAGIVYFNQTLQQYEVSVHQPGTIDAVDIGLVCGTLPTALQANGTKVTVSGTFKEYGLPAPKALPAGYTYYYLEVSSIQ